MNDEQNEPENKSETNNTSGKQSPATGASDLDNPVAQTNDDYYAVDYAKKDVLSTIGDGEMHDEGLVGAGKATDILSSTDTISDEQDLAESRDSEQ